MAMAIAMVLEKQRSCEEGRETRARSSVAESEIVCSVRGA